MVIVMVCRGCYGTLYYCQCFYLRDTSSRDFVVFIVVAVFGCLHFCILEAFFFVCFNQFSTFTRTLFCFVVGYFTTSWTYQL